MDALDVQSVSIDYVDLTVEGPFSMATAEPSRSSLSESDVALLYRK